MIVIHSKYNSVLILRAGQLGVLVKYTSRLEGNNLASDCTNLNCVSKNNIVNTTVSSRVLSGKPIS